MATLKYKIGDKVILTDGNIMTIDQIDDISKWYRMKEDPWNCYTDEMIEGIAKDEIMVTQNLKESLRKASRKYAGVKEDADLEEETYLNPHKVVQMQAYEAGFKAALVVLSGFIDHSIKEL